MKDTQDWLKADAPLSHRFAIYLPSCDNTGKVIVGFAGFADSTSRMLCDLFGGVTTYPAKGLFQRNSGIPQSEEILVMESFCDANTWARESGFLRAWARVVSAILCQDSIACSLDGNMSFVEPGHLQGGQPDMGDDDALRRFVSDYEKEREEGC